MKFIAVCLIGLIGVVSAVAGQIDIQPVFGAVERVKVPPDHSFPWFKENYPYMIMKDSVFSAESEFFWPKGFTRIPEKKLSNFQNWIAHLPLWHAQRAVGSESHGFVFTPDQVARPIHLVRWKSRFSDQTIALILQAQYLEMKKKQDDFKVMPIAGDTLTYHDFLNGTVAFGSRGQVVFQKSDPRPAGRQEFVDFVDLCDQQMSYKRLAENCQPVAQKDLLPGDMYITFDEAGFKGKIVFIIAAIADKKGNKLFAIGEGCESECDFHIPLLNNDKNFPWITADQIAARVPPREHAGYFRPRIQ